MVLCSVVCSVIENAVLVRTYARARASIRVLSRHTNPYTKQYTTCTLHLLRCARCLKCTVLRVCVTHPGTRTSTELDVLACLIGSFVCLAYLIGFFGVSAMYNELAITDDVRQHTHAMCIVCPCCVVRACSLYSCLSVWCYVVCVCV